MNLMGNERNRRHREARKLQLRVFLSGSVLMAAIVAVVVIVELIERMGGVK